MHSGSRVQGYLIVSSSGIINKAFRKHVSPVLRAAGFERVNARNGWARVGPSVWVFNIRAVGSYFSSVTGWPPASVCVWLGVFYEFFPQRIPEDLKIDNSGRLLPAEGLCQMRSHLDRQLDQQALIQSLRNPAERRRRDIWWLEANGENSEEVAKDIANVLSTEGLPWFQQCSDLPSVLALIEQERDCYNKYFRALHIARFVGDTEREHLYAELEATERAHLQRF